MKSYIIDACSSLSTKDLSSLFLSLSLLIVFSGAPVIAQSLPECQLPHFGTISVDSEIEVNGTGQNVDTIEFWEAPDSTETLMFVSAKNNELV
ncbi:MAG: hypothetical protein IH784_02745, partial [Bacteroidetes bacterium]|nr:hypothetical protein [Bacteroidota bacterium]